MKALENLTPNEQQALDELVGRLRHQFKKQIAQVILFGSRARGDASWESDFDLLIVTKNGGTKLEKTLTEFPNPIGFEHNLVLTSHVIPQKEFVLKRKAEPFYRSIYSEGIDLIGKKPRRLARGKPLVYRPPTRGFKMDENARIQIKIRRDRALDYLGEAQSLFDLKKFPGAVSRAYYAVFTFTSAVLLTLDLVRAKHSGVESAFSEYFIRDKRIEEEFKDIFLRAKNERELADYKFKNYTQEQAQQILSNCERFVARMERYLREVGALKE
ncbi:MAG: HEPN domain-containing protein [Chloroflexi bacterium]|nr:HEPN domain-containing protein [Chloroflexota bacterium]